MSDIDALLCTRLLVPPSFLEALGHS